MRIKSILAGAAIAFAAGIGSASAAEQFSTLEGLAAEALAPHEMGAIIAAVVFTIDPKLTIGTPNPADGFTNFDVIVGPTPGPKPPGGVAGMQAGLASGSGAPGGGIVVTFVP